VSFLSVKGKINIIRGLAGFDHNDNLLGIRKYDAPVGKHMRAYGIEYDCTHLRMHDRTACSKAIGGGSGGGGYDESVCPITGDEG
jgi:hypothetical protein